MADDMYDFMRCRRILCSSAIKTTDDFDCFGTGIGSPFAGRTARILRRVIQVDRDDPAVINFKNLCNPTIMSF
jgi:hypothetical protein